MVLANRSEAYKLERDISRVPRQRPNTNKKSGAITSKQIFEASAFSVLILGLAIMYVAQYARMALISDQLYQENKPLKELKAENGHLKLQLMKLSALSRIEELARGEGRMVEPGRIKYMALSKESRDNDDNKGTGRAETLRLDVERIAKPAHSTVD